MKVFAFSVRIRHGKEKVRFFLILGKDYRFPESMAGKVSSAVWVKTVAAQ